MSVDVDNIDVGEVIKPEPRQGRITRMVSPTRLLTLHPRLRLPSLITSKVIIVPGSSYFRLIKRCLSIMATKYKIVLVRHGESIYNQKNLFCGWHDADLSDTGINEAIYAGQLLKKGNYEFDIAFTSVLKRAVKTLYLIQEELDAHWLPVVKSWRLNERHYGGLQGLNKSETAAKYGEDQVQIWRRSYDIPPPPLEKTDDRWSGKGKQYANMDQGMIPACECLKDTVERTLPFWYDSIVPAIKSGQKVLISAHGNSLRGMIKYLDNVSDNDIVGLNLPTAIPLVYELDENLRPVKHYYLASEEEVKAAQAKVAAQGKAK